jgi:hypothetical protein
MNAIKRNGCEQCDLASFHLIAQRHHLSPGLRPGNVAPAPHVTPPVARVCSRARAARPLGVARSLPLAAVNFKNSAVMMAQLQGGGSRIKQQGGGEAAASSSSGIAVVMSVAVSSSSSSSKPHTTCEPRSESSVRQKPSRKYPERGAGAYEVAITMMRARCGKELSWMKYGLQ